jgi:hypothetical protein
MRRLQPPTIVPEEHRGGPDRRHLGGKGKIVMVKTTLGGASATAREDGFQDELKARFPGIQTLDERFGMPSIAQEFYLGDSNS